MITTNGTYLWPLLTQIFRDGQPAHVGDRKAFEVMTSDEYPFPTIVISTFSIFLNIEYICTYKQIVFSNLGRLENKVYHLSPGGYSRTCLF
jgi:hypothetical protein